MNPSSQPIKAKMLTIEGTLVMFLFLDPHSFLILTDSGGAQWTVEWNGAKVLRRQGVTADTLKPGDHVAVTGYPAEHGPKLYLMNITRPSDNWEWRRGKSTTA